MGKLEERESRRKASVVGSMVNNSTLTTARGKNRPKEKRELKKRVSLSVLPSLYADIQKIAYIQRRSVSDMVSDMMEQFRAEHEKELEEYRKIKHN